MMCTHTHDLLRRLLASQASSPSSTFQMVPMSPFHYQTLFIDDLGRAGQERT